MKTALIAISLLGSALAANAADPKPHAAGLENAGYRLVWNDEFNAPGYTPADMDGRWVTPPARSAAWNKYIANRDDLRMQHDGSIWLIAKENDGKNPDDTRPWISGALKSQGKFNFLYGYAEARMRTPYIDGSFPAFWLMPENSPLPWPECGEIDIFEQANPDGRSWHTIHGAWNKGGSGGYTSEPVKVDYNDWHIYGLEWTPEKLEWFVDGKSVFTVKRDDPRLLGTWPFDYPYYVILNQSVGNGGFAGNPIPGKTYLTEVDYVRVFQKPGQTNHGGLKP